MKFSTTTSTVKTRVIILSDTHNKRPFHALDTTRAYRWPLPNAELLLHAGDLTMSGRQDEHQAQVDMLTEHPAELKVVVPGNHDITLDDPYYADHQRQHFVTEDTAAIKEMYTGAAAKKAGIVLMTEGVQTFTLKTGARFSLYASAYQPEFCGWAFGYERSEDRFNPTSLVKPAVGTDPANPIPSHPAIDIVVTHGPPYGILDSVGGFGTKRPRSSVGCQHLLRAVKRCKPRIHAFGHIHEGWGAQRVQWLSSNESVVEGERLSVEMDREVVSKERGVFVDVSSDGARPLHWGHETLFVNGSIMDERYNARNAPWIVDLDLIKASVV